MAGNLKCCWLRALMKNSVSLNVVTTPSNARADFGENYLFSNKIPPPPLSSCRKKKNRRTFGGFLPSSLRISPAVTFYRMK